MNRQRDAYIVSLLNDPAICKVPQKRNAYLNRKQGIPWPDLHLVWDMRCSKHCCADQIAGFPIDARQKQVALYEASVNKFLLQCDPENIV